jgi:transposase
VPDVPPAPDELAVLRTASARLREVIEAKDTEIGALRAVIEAFPAQVEELRAEVEALRARLRQNPRNSSKPPSGEGLAKPAPGSQRRKSGRKPGRPKGQPGATLELADHPDAVVTHEPGRCAGCGTGLFGSAVTGTERRQVVDLPEEIRALVTEHRIISRRCGCGAVTAGTAPAGVSAPAQYGPRISAACAYLRHGQFLSRDRTREAMGDLFGVTISPGAISGMAARIAGAVKGCLDARSAAR